MVFSYVTFTKQPIKTEMLRFIIRRTAYSLLILIGVTILTFVLFRMAAGDPTTTLLGKNPSPEEMERVRTSLGADKPLFYGKWRRTEAFTNASFLKERTAYRAFRIDGSGTAGFDGLRADPGCKLVFTSNFALDDRLRVEVAADGPVLLNGVAVPVRDGLAGLE